MAAGFSSVSVEYVCSSMLGQRSTAPRNRDPKPPHARYREWSHFDPYKDNAGCVIRVARRPSSLVAPPRARAIAPRGGEPSRDPLAQQAETLAARAAAELPLPSAPLDPKLIQAIAEVTRSYLMGAAPSSEEAAAEAPSVDATCDAGNSTAVEAGTQTQPRTRDTGPPQRQPGGRTGKASVGKVPKGRSQEASARAASTGGSEAAVSRASPSVKVAKSCVADVTLLPTPQPTCGPGASAPAGAESSPATVYANSSLPAREGGSGLGGSGSGGAIRWPAAELQDAHLAASLASGLSPWHSPAPNPAGELSGELPLPGDDPNGLPPPLPPLPPRELASDPPPLWPELGADSNDANSLPGARASSGEMAQLKEQLEADWSLGSHPGGFPAAGGTTGTVLSGGGDSAGSGLGLGHIHFSDLPSVALQQLDDLDSMLHQHQRELRARAARLRAEKQARCAWWRGVHGGAVRMVARCAWWRGVHDGDAAGGESCRESAVGGCHSPLQPAPLCLGRLSMQNGTRACKTFFQRRRRQLQRRLIVGLIVLSPTPPRRASPCRNPRVSTKRPTRPLPTPLGGSGRLPACPLDT